jgi:hypothetical protein
MSSLPHGSVNMLRNDPSEKQPLDATWQGYKRMCRTLHS